eukprot:4293572-Amphidinium_carterae.1
MKFQYRLAADITEKSELIAQTNDDDDDDDNDDDDNDNDDDNDDYDDDDEHHVDSSQQPCFDLKGGRHVHLSFLGVTSAH